MRNLLLLLFATLQFTQVKAQVHFNINFTASPGTVCIGEPVQFTDLTEPTPETWKWTFVGGTPSTSTLQHPVVTFQTPQKYNAILHVTKQSSSDIMGKLYIVTVDACTNLENISPLPSVNLFPNPAKHFLTIESAVDLDYKIYDVLGHTLCTGEFKSGKEIINLEKYSPGVYFITVHSGKQRYTSKFIKE